MSQFFFSQRVIVIFNGKSMKKVLFSYREKILDNIHSKQLKI